MAPFKGAKVRKNIEKMWKNGEINDNGDENDSNNGDVDGNDNENLVEH